MKKLIATVVCAVAVLSIEARVHERRNDCGNNS